MKLTYISRQTHTKVKKFPVVGHLNAAISVHHIMLLICCVWVFLRQMFITVSNVPNTMLSLKHTHKNILRRAKNKTWR